jgi:hypothetical protein
MKTQRNPSTASTGKTLVGAIWLSTKPSRKRNAVGAVVPAVAEVVAVAAEEAMAVVVAAVVEDAEGIAAAATVGIAATAGEILPRRLCSPYFFEVMFDCSAHSHESIRTHSARGA